MEDWNSASPSKADAFDAFASVVKALANGRRLELLELMAQGEHSVEELATLGSMGVTTTSAHLQVLKRAGLVATRRERTTIFYRLAGDDVARLYVAAKRVGLDRSADLREAVSAHLSPRDGGSCPTIDPAAVTEAMLVLDVRPPSEYSAGHFPSAVSIPLDQLADRWAEVDDGRVVVVYCRGEFCRLARDAARMLRARGVDARAMDEGIIEWRATGEVSLDDIA